MVDLKEKSREEIFREKKEAELREAKRKEGEWKRRKDKERKCMIGGTFGWQRMHGDMVSY